MVSYTRPCTQGTCDVGFGCTKEGLPCEISSQCAGGGCIPTGSCGCQAALAHSTLFSNCSKNCSVTGSCARCVSFECSPSCQNTLCSSGTCGYNCDSGYTWNGSACVLIPISSHFIIGDGLTMFTKFFRTALFYFRYHFKSDAFNILHIQPHHSIPCHCTRRFYHGRRFIFFKYKILKPLRIL